MDHSTNYFPFCVQQTIRSFPPPASHCLLFSTSAVLLGIRSSLFHKLKASFKGDLGWMEAELPFPISCWHQLPPTLEVLKFDY